MAGPHLSLPLLIMRTTPAPSALPLKQVTGLIAAVGKMVVSNAFLQRECACFLLLP